MDSAPETDGVDLPSDKDETPEPSTTKLDTALRPKTLDDFVGQAELVQRLRLWLAAASERSEPLDHTVFSGPPGLGKTTLAMLIASHSGGKLVNAHGAAIDKPLDLVSTLCALKTGDVLFIDEIHRLPRAVEEYLYTAMEDWRIDVTTEKNGSVSLNLNRFTLIGATTRYGQLTAPLRARFKITERLEPYELEPLTTIAQASAKKLGMELSTDAGQTIAKRCRGTPRRVNTYLARLLDVVTVRNITEITPDICAATGTLLEIDEMGLDRLDRSILHALNRVAGKPVGLTALGQMVHEEPRTIEDAHEPYLLQLGLVTRTPRGRMITDAGIRAIGGEL